MGSVENTERCAIAREVFIEVVIPLFISFFLTFIFIYLLAAQDLSCGMWDLVPQPGIKPGPQN